MQLAIRAIERRPASTREAEGTYFADLVQRALAEGEGPDRGSPVAVVVRSRRTELVDLKVPRASGVALHGFLAGLTRSNPAGRGLPVAVGVAGRFRLKGADGAPVPVGVAFLEWPDCGWWHWQVLLDAGGTPLDATVVRRCAEEGDRMPSGLGRWWSLGRRTGVRVHYGERGSVGFGAARSTLVH